MIQPWIPPKREHLEPFFKACGYVPREVDQWPILVSEARIVVVGGGQQSGKTTNEGHAAAAHAMCNLNEVIWIVGPDYFQAKKEFKVAHDALKKTGMIDKSKPFSMPMEGPQTLTTLLTNCTVVTKTAEEVIKLAGESPGLILQVEAGQQDISVFEQLLSRTAGKKSQLRVSGTFEKAQAWYDGLWKRGEIYPNAESIQSFSMPSWNNTALYELGENDPEFLFQRGKLGERDFLRRFAGKPPPLEGQVYTDFDRDKHTCKSFTIPSWYFLYRVIDAGISDLHPFCCLWIAVNEHRDIFVYRELHLKGKTIEEAAGQVKALSGKEEYKRSLIDPSAFSRSRQTGWTDAREFGRFGIQVSPANSRDSARISRVIQSFRVDKIKIFSDRCPNLIRTLPLQMWDTKVGAERRDSRIEDDPVDCLEYFITFLGAPVLEEPKDRARLELKKINERTDLTYAAKQEMIKAVYSRLESERFWRERASMKPEDNWRVADGAAI